MLLQRQATDTRSVLDGPAPPLLEPLFDAAKRRLPLEQSAQSVVRALGFDSFILAFTTFHQLRSDGKFYFCTSVPLQWVAEYDRCSYIEIDPRTIHCWNNLTPLIWDRRIAGADPQLTGLFERAAHYGIGSGVCVPLRGDPHSRGMLGLNVVERDVDEPRAHQWNAAMGDIMLLAVHFHATFLRSVVDYEMQPPQRGFPLSARERECLQLCARGQTNGDIARKLAISERTVQFHFSNMLSKLEAVNRQEAVALAISAGIIQR
jgi:LuxR family transcriptional regulator, quorum-sensing system regulator LasR